MTEITQIIITCEGLAPAIDLYSIYRFTTRAINKETVYISRLSGNGENKMSRAIAIISRTKRLLS